MFSSSLNLTPFKSTDGTYKSAAPIGQLPVGPKSE